MAEHAMTLRLDEQTHERLRREAFEQRTTITELVRDAIAAQVRGWDQDDASPWPVSREAAASARRVRERLAICNRHEHGTDAAALACARQRSRRSSSSEGSDR